MGPNVPLRHQKTVLRASATVPATVTDNPTDLKLAGYRQLVITLDVTAAERDSGNETYDVYIFMSDGLSSWDIVHFPQIAATGAKRYTARVLAERLAEVTTAGPGVASEPSATLRTDTAGSNNGITTLTAGVVRHGPFADAIGVAVVVAGTVATGITFSVQVQAGG